MGPARWMVLLIGLAAPAWSAAPEVVCADSPVTAIGWAHAEADQVCSAVRDALDALRAMGLAPSEHWVVRPLDAAAALECGHPVGQFDARTREIRIVPLDAVLGATFAAKPALGVPMDRAFWRSCVAHEIAHAVAETHFASGTLRLAASEYIAAVVQLKVLPGEVRDRVLLNFEDAHGWGEGAEISGVFYLIDPSKFAVKSFRHFAALSPEAGREFVRQILREGLKN
jgi:hypothetical protein